MPNRVHFIASCKDRFNVFRCTMINVDTLSPKTPKVDWFSPKLWKYLLRDHLSGIKLILLLDWTSLYTHLLLTFTKSRWFLNLKLRHGTEKIETILNKPLSTLNIIRRLKTPDVWSTWLVTCPLTQLNLNQAQHVDTVPSVHARTFDFLEIREGKIIKTLHSEMSWTTLS